MISCFDSSLLLSILLNEPRAGEASVIWKSNDVRVSSILLKLETNIVLRRRYKQLKNEVSNDWLKEKLFELNSFFKEFFFADINDNFENSASKYYDTLSKCKSLDAIHIATVLDISEKYDKSEICVCSFDNNMLALAKQLGFNTRG